MFVFCWQSYFGRNNIGEKDKDIDMYEVTEKIAADEKEVFLRVGFCYNIVVYCQGWWVVARSYNKL